MLAFIRGGFIAGRPCASDEIRDRANVHDHPALTVSNNSPLALNEILVEAPQ